MCIISLWVYTLYVPQALRQLMCHAYTPACVQCAIGHNLSICMHSHDLQYSSICIIYTVKLMIKAMREKTSTAFTNFLQTTKIYWTVLQCNFECQYMQLYAKSLLLLSIAKLQRFSYSMIISNEPRNYATQLHTFYHLQYLCLHREDIHISSDNAIQLTQLVQLTQKKRYLIVGLF